MFVGENTAPADLVFGIPTEPSPVCYDHCSVEMEDKQKTAYRLDRQHLGAIAERLKRRYRTLLPQAKYLWQAARIANMAINAGCS